jgi:hypothetical protein
MSALPPKADIAERDPHVRFVPKADIDPNAASRKRALLRSVAARCCFNDDRAHHVGGPGTIIAVDVAIRA